MLQHPSRVRRERGKGHTGTQIIVGPRQPVAVVGQAAPLGAAQRLQSLPAAPVRWQKHG